MSCKYCEDVTIPIECGDCRANMTEQIKQHWFAEFKKAFEKNYEDMLGNKNYANSTLYKDWFGPGGDFEVKQ